eukprot:PhF_6_TR5779/c0_g1_i2/m.8532
MSRTEYLLTQAKKMMQQQQTLSSIQGALSPPRKPSDQFSRKVPHRIQPLLPDLTTTQPITLAPRPPPQPKGVDSTTTTTYRVPSMPTLETSGSKTFAMSLNEAEYDFGGGYDDAVINTTTMPCRTNESNLQTPPDAYLGGDQQPTTSSSSLKAYKKWLKAKMKRSNSLGGNENAGGGKKACVKAAKAIQRFFWRYVMPRRPGLITCYSSS